MTYKHTEMFQKGVQITPDPQDPEELARRKELFRKMGMRLEKDGSYPAPDDLRLVKALNTLAVRGSSKDIEQFFQIYRTPVKLYYNDKWCIGLAARCSGVPALEILARNHIGSPIDSRILMMVFMENIPEGLYPKSIEQLLRKSVPAKESVRQKALVWLLDHTKKKEERKAFAMEAVLSDQKQAAEICRYRYSKPSARQLEDLFNGRPSGIKAKYYVILSSVELRRRGEILLNLAQRALDMDIKPVITRDLCELLEWDWEVIFRLAQKGRFVHGKLNFLKTLVDQGDVLLVRQAADSGMLKTASVRDGLIDYAREQGKTEILAMLLDWKNTNANLAKEQENRMKREEARLMEKPDSAAALKRSWSTEKLSDNTLMITSWKSCETGPSSWLVEVPDRIGKSAVSVIGKSAFALMGSSRPIRPEYERNRRRIRAVIVPEGIHEIQTEVFCESQIQNLVLPASLDRINLETFLTPKHLSFVILRNPDLKIEKTSWGYWQDWRKKNPLHIFVPENTPLENQLEFLSGKNPFLKGAVRIESRPAELLDKMQKLQEARVRQGLDYDFQTARSLC